MYVQGVLMANMSKRSFAAPDDVMKAERSVTNIIKLGGRTVAMITFKPGWQWSKDVKPTVGTSLCMKHHFGYAMSGKMRIRMDNGTEAEYNAGDLVDIPPGHDGWVVGNQPAVLLDFGDPCSCG
jgi:hypothetical protein